jgi:hypothetical protein
MSDNLAVKPRSTLLTAISRGESARPPEPAHGGGDGGGPDDPERSDPLPRPGTPYMAHARRTAKPQMTLFFVGKGYLPDGFSYANLERVWLEESEQQGSGPVLVARFAGSVVTEVTIEGRHMHTLCNAIGMHLMPWVWEHPSPRDFTDDNATVVRKITFKTP